MVFVFLRVCDDIKLHSATVILLTVYFGRCAFSLLSTTTGMRILPRQIFGGLSLMSQSRVTCKHIETPRGILIVLTFLCFMPQQHVIGIFSKMILLQLCNKLIFLILHK